MATSTQTTLHQELDRLAATIGGEVSEKGDELRLKAVIAERKVFLSRKKLEYQAKIKVDEAARKLVFSEMLKESGMGLGSGSGYDSGDFGMSPGFGFKTESYSVGLGGRSGSIEEQSRLFGKDYDYQFSYEQFRDQVRALADRLGYEFEYRIW